MAAVLGLGAYGSPATVWASKVGEIDDSPTGGPAAMGLDLEPFILREAGRRLACDVTGAQEVAESTDCPRLRATLDGILLEAGHRIPPECQFVTADACTWGSDPTLDWDALGRWLAEGHAGAPFPAGTRAESAYVQINAQMLTLNAPHGYLAGVMGARAGYLLRIGQPMPSASFRLLRVPADRDLQDRICRSVPAFWAAHVATGTPPPDIAAKDLDSIKRHLRQHRAGHLAERLDLAPLARRLHQERARTKHHGARAKAMEARLRAELGDVERCISGPWTITAKTTARGARPIRLKRDHA